MHVNVVVTFACAHNRKTCIFSSTVVTKFYGYLKEKVTLPD
jgi:hypothetical protein